jgi:hypothetical protein
MSVDEEAGEATQPIRSALAQRLEQASWSAARETGDGGLALGDLAEVLRAAVGEASDPFLGSLEDGEGLGGWLARVQRAADVATRAIAALAWLPEDGAGPLVTLAGDAGVADVCDLGGVAFVLADRALTDAVRAVRAAPWSRLEAEAALERSRKPLRTVVACLRFLELRCQGAGASGAVVTELCETCGAGYAAERRRGVRRTICPACRLQRAAGAEAGDPEALRELAGALRARGGQVSAADVDVVWRCLGVDDLFAAPLGQGPVDGTLPDGTSPFRQGRDRKPARTHGAVRRAVGRQSGAGRVEPGEAVRYLEKAGRDRLWWLALEDVGVAEAVARRRAVEGDRVAASFLEESREVRELVLPQGHAFGEGSAPMPSVMQRLVAVRVRRDRRVGWFSGTGTGKTLAGVLASRVCDSRLTLVLCANQTVDQWEATIRGCFPGASVAVKAAGPPGQGRGGRYLVLNWEALQDEERFSRLRRALRRDPADLVILDEIHAAKQRDERVLSLRRQRAAALLAEQDRAAKGGLRVLGMTATPVLNVLREGRALIELVEGRERPDLGEAPTQANCLAVHRALATIGMVWTPPRPAQETVSLVPVAAERALRAFLSLPDELRTVAGLERLLVRAKLPAIRAAVRRGTVVYTSLVDGIVPVIVSALERDGWRVGLCIGENKSGLRAFREGWVDVLVGSPAVSLGIDGLQLVADRVVVAVLPWTQAEMEQLTGRLNRRGQLSPTVEVHVPVGRVQVDSLEWSWCERRLELLARKGALAGAVMHGRVEAIDEVAAQRLLGRALDELGALTARATWAAAA